MKQRSTSNDSEEIFKGLDESPKGKTCKAMKGLVEEGSEILEEEGEQFVLDAGIIAAAQKVEHYEIASYGTVRAWAKLLGKRKRPICCSKPSTKKERPIRI